MLFGGKPHINMDLKCFDNAGAELVLTIDEIYKQPLAYTSPPRDALIKVTDNTGRIRTYRRNRFIELKPHCCHDCYKDTLGSPKDYYMVYYEVWYQYGLGDQPGMLCVNCLEQRMGHPLQALQLMAIPLNTYVGYI
jgi:hypothetical protein